MKKIFVLSAAVLVALLQGCQQEPTGNVATEIQEKPDPEISFSGVPKDTLESGKSFTFTVGSLSDGKITVAVDKPTAAILKPNADTTAYKITAFSAKTQKVTITATQVSTVHYANAKKTASFIIHGYGAVDLPGPDDAITGTEVTYTEATGVVYGPERGLYTGFEISSDADVPTAADISAKRVQGYNVLLLEFNLNQFVSGGGISADYLTVVQKAFDAVRAGGCKAIVRFAYIFAYNEATDWPSVVTDPEVDKVLDHVEQLQPVLTKNEDVIFVVQAGFVGAWGEWYYSTHFKQPGSKESYESRKQLMDALLKAVPASRQIELRTPEFKFKLGYEKSLADTLTADTAHDGSTKSRLGGHNDCFLADAEDRGTFPADSLRTFWKAESRYTIMGGETCGLSDYGLCENTIKDLEDYHWTYLNDGYHEGVIARWKTDGCYNTIKERLGYRLVLKDVHYDAITVGQQCKVTIRFYNKGFAAPQNPREAWLVWVDPDGGEEKYPLGFDPCTWHSGYNAAVGAFIPTSEKGTLYLELSDPLLSSKPEYSLPLANTDIFDPTTGYNKLFEIN
ncbi:MAG: DUF4832 domain-containing protein [Bacteroidales bacterium]|nr:DUF4832 domain-containing protein [Bacteroidales bacterium]